LSRRVDFKHFQFLQLWYEFATWWQGGQGNGLSGSFIILDTEYLLDNNYVILLEKKKQDRCL